MLSTVLDTVILRSRFSNVDEALKGLSGLTSLTFSAEYGRISTDLSFLQNFARNFKVLKIAHVATRDTVNPISTIPFDLMTNLTSLSLGCIFSEKASQKYLAAAILRLPELVDLEITISPRVSPNLARTIGSMKNLRRLRLRKLTLTADFASAIGTLTNLKELNLALENAEKDSFNRLKGLSKLKSLTLHPVKTANIGVRCDASISELILLLNALPNLDRVRVVGLFTKTVSASVTHKICPFISDLKI